MAKKVYEVESWFLNTDEPFKVQIKGKKNLKSLLYALTEAWCNQHEGNGFRWEWEGTGRPDPDELFFESWTEKDFGDIASFKRIK